jgi:MarR family transcriptional regulator, lower aerobic nicotinate degradation pathway regulator
VLDGFGAVGSFLAFSGKAISSIFIDLILRRKFFKEVERQISDIVVGVGAVVVGGGMVFVIATMSLATGATVGIQGYEGLRALGAESLTGIVASFGNIREITPLIAGVAFAAYVGASFTAELGAKRISDEIEKSGKPPSLREVYAAPAHLIRRCHQISVSLFAEELGEYGLTPIQYAAMLAVRDKPGIDQRGLGRTIAIDRSTIATVVKSLEARLLVRRITPPDDLRVKRLYISQDGEALLSRTVEEISRVQQRLLAPLTEAEQDLFMSLLARLVDVNNRFSRAPLRFDILAGDR